MGGEVIWAPTANSLLEATANTDVAQIGLADNGTLLPIDGGLRDAFRSGRTTAGALAKRQAAAGDQGATAFAVARGSRFFGRATRLGATVALREGTAGRGVAATYGLTRAMPDFAAGVSGALVTNAYQPQAGFVSRPNVPMTSPSVTSTAQPRWRPSDVVWITHGPTALVSQDPRSFTLQAALMSYSGELLFRHGASITPAVEQSLQRPTAPVVLFPTVRIAPGTYDFTRVTAVFNSDQSAEAAATATIPAGPFFDGSLDRFELTSHWSPSPYRSLRGTCRVNRLRSLGTRDSSVLAHLAGPEVRVFLNPRVQWSAFYQHNTAAVPGTPNVRFSREFSPLCVRPIVYSDRQVVLNGMTPTARSLILTLRWLRQM
ncbi:MAG: hypothetical protein ACK50C_04660 [Gemmatimonadaceae bacterium]